MFKKPLSNLKTSAPLRSSDRRKLKQRIVQAFALSPEDGDLLVPDGLLSVKFSTHLEAQGVAYLSPEGDPLWFTQDSEEIVPTIYTLWKRPDMLPFLSTPSAVIPVLIGGADLMVPGVVEHTPPLHAKQLVSVTQYTPGKIGPPLAVGRMALSCQELRQDGQKGKAVLVLHTWKDYLWDLGGKGDPPEPVALYRAPPTERDDDALQVESPIETDKHETPLQLIDGSAYLISDADNAVPDSEYTREEVSDMIRKSLLQAIRTSLSKLPPGSFPMSSTNFYSSYILPSRPAVSLSSNTPIDIKHSTHKSLTGFLKTCEKDGLLKLKDTKSDVVVVSVSPKHNDVEIHRVYTTVKDIEMRKEKKEEREESEKNKIKEMVVKELWKPHQQSISFFDCSGNSTTALYSLQDIKNVLENYIAQKNLVNAREQQYINIDDHLRSAVTAAKSNETIEFLKRDELLKRLMGKMQNWNEIQAEGKDAVIKKGELKPITVVVKIRQGRKASTLVSAFEPFFITAEFLVEELRRICASATSASPITGKNSGMEVLVQGKHLKAVVDLLMSKGVPKKWIEMSDISNKKK